MHRFLVECRSKCVHVHLCGFVYVCEVKQQPDSCLRHILEMVDESHEGKQHIVQQNAF